MAQSVEKISVTVPTDLLWSVKAEMKATGRNRSQVITNCIRAKLAPETTAGHDNDILEPRFPSGPSQEDFDQLADRVSEIERVAESQGAM